VSPKLFEYAFEDGRVPLDRTTNTSADYNSAIGGLLGLHLNEMTNLDAIANANMRSVSIGEADNFYNKAILNPDGTTSSSQTQKVLFLGVIDSKTHLSAVIVLKSATKSFLQDSFASAANSVYFLDGGTSVALAVYKGDQGLNILSVGAKHNGVINYFSDKSINNYIVFDIAK